MRHTSKRFMTFMSLALISVFAVSEPLSALAETETSYSQYQSGEGAQKPSNESSYTVISVSTEEELAALAQDCQLDVWSRDKYVKLENDISLKEHTDLTIPSFGGIFDGGGHRISNLEISQAGSAQGLFRYLQSTGTVRDLEVSGKVAPDGTGSQVGVLAGVNYGRILNCTVYGSVIGSQDVGGVAGLNETSGEIRNCQAAVTVVGDHSAGGICGTNNGTLNSCKNSGGINIYSTEVEYGLEDLTMENLEDLNSAANMEAHTDTGGIAGYSEGKIYYCSNSGTVGYSHIGYNTGGIVGRLHQGYIQGCSNTGHVMGRKDTGGIVGQMEPFLEIQYLNDSLNEIDREAERFFDLLEAAQGDISSYGSQAADLASDVTANLQNVNAATEGILATTNDMWYLYNQELTGLASDLQRLGNEMAEEVENQTEGTLPDLTVGEEDWLGTVSGGDLNLQLPDYMESYRAALRRFGENAADHVSNVTTAAQDKSGGIVDNLNTLNSGLEAAGSGLRQLADVLDQGAGAISADVEAVIAQSRVLYRAVLGVRDDLFRYEGMEVSDDSDEAAGEELGDSQTTQDAYYDTSSFQQGKVTLCENRGLVEADNSVGGIVGQVATEYDFDPEEDISVTGPESFNLEQTVKAIVRESRNYGDVVGKKNYVGGVVGRADFGAVISCESYGAVSSSDGSYVGGIAGSSSYCVRSCYAMGELAGKDYVGGIAGQGCDIFYSYAYPLLEFTGECGGSIAGQLSEDGILCGNYYVQGNVAGIDSIGYEGGATPLTYEAFCSSEGVPDAFSQFTVSFQADGKELASFRCRYGEAIDPDLIPEIPEKEGYYGIWPEFDFTCVTGNRVLEAQYEKWISTLASEERSEDGKARVLVQGEFLPDMRLTLTESAEGTTLGIRSTKDGAEEYTDTVTVRAYCEKPEDTLAEIYENGGYRRAQTEVMGSYLEFSMEPAGTFRLVEKADDNTEKIAVIVGAVLLAAVAALIVRGVRKAVKKRRDK